MEFNRNMLLAVISHFGPSTSREHRPKAPNLYIEQGCLKISALIEHIRQHVRLGQTMWIEIQWAQVTAGAGFALPG
jgi:hypothetical protein